MDEDYGDEYEFEYEDQDNNYDAAGEDDVAVRIQNSFYSGKGATDTDEAMQLFQEVLQLADESGQEFAEWAFKAVKNMVKTSFRAGKMADMLSYYKQLLERINKGDVTRNRAEKAINSILDLVSSSSSSSGSSGSGSAATFSPTNGSGESTGSSNSSSSSSTGAGTDISALLEFFSVTSAALEKQPGNERSAFKTKLKLARLYQQQKDWAALRPLLQSLLDSLFSSDMDDQSKATQQLEVYALQITLYTDLRDMKRLTDVYRRARAVKAAVPHPGITGTIFECGGKLGMRDRDWEKARVDFLEAFKSYGEAGNTARTVACLKYLLLANMLSGGQFNPFDTQEAKAYEKDPQIVGMTLLTNAYLSNDIAAFEPILKKHADTIASDDFLKEYMGDLMDTIRAQVLTLNVSPYRRVKLTKLAAQLSISDAEVETLLVSLIVEGRLNASIDQLEGVLLMGQGGTTTAASSSSTASGNTSATAASRGAGSLTSSPSSSPSSSAVSTANAAAASAAVGNKYAELERLASELRNLIVT